VSLRVYLILQSVISINICQEELCVNHVQSHSWNQYNVVCATIQPIIWLAVCKLSSTHRHIIYVT